MPEVYEVNMKGVWHERVRCVVKYCSTAVLVLAARGRSIKPHFGRLKHVSSQKNIFFWTSYVPGIYILLVLFFPKVFFHSRVVGAFFCGHGLDDDGDELK